MVSVDDFDVSPGAKLTVLGSGFVSPRAILGSRWPSSLPDEAGMWADTNLNPPKGLTTRSPAEVGDAVVHAIETNRAVVNVAPLGLRVGAVAGRAAPTAVVRFAPRLGVNELTDAMAAALRHKR